jgi:hypothetical protein
MKKLIAGLLMAASMGVSASNYLDSVKEHLSHNGMRYIQSSGLWQTNIGTVYSAVTMFDGKTYVAKICGVEKTGYTYCISSEDYRQLVGK